MSAYVAGSHAEIVRRLLNGGRTSDELLGLPADPICIVSEGWK